MEDYDYSFSQNGLVAYKAGELIAEQVRSRAFSLMRGKIFGSGLEARELEAVY